MKKNKHLKRIKGLIFVCVAWFAMLTVATYGWFIGMKTVNVNAFDVEIASTEGLYLSMDGETWTYSLDAKNATPYTGHTNTWAETGLIPLSTIGEVDPSASRMILYEKGSLTTTPGGYRLLTSRVDNSTAEKNGYVAFDLFIKNTSGHAYYTENDVLNEEAIYLTTNSAVTVASSGGEAGTGIENSVRVAFAKIGRVNASETTVETITGITCADSTDVTGICDSATIWEPNDYDHVQNAINWYNTSCASRNGTSVTSKASYGEYGTCGAVSLVDATTKTYAISRVIGINDNVDVYDGERYNGYTANVNTYANYTATTRGLNATALEAAKANYKLIDYPYFTDTMKKLEGNDRPIFMTLAPNSITKVRVYVYIEGQDIDNYDFASLGKKVTINFGFTKERYIESDIDYEGPELPATNPSTFGD